MVQLIKNPRVTVVTKEVQSKDGKCDITIHLDLNLNVTGGSVDLTEKEEEEKDCPFEYTIPDFKLQKIKFGEKVT